jgi:hypothetical protein
MLLFPSSIINIGDHTRLLRPAMLPLHGCQQSSLIMRFYFRVSNHYIDGSQWVVHDKAYVLDERELTKMPNQGLLCFASTGYVVLSFSTLYYVSCLNAEQSLCIVADNADEC